MSALVWAVVGLAAVCAVTAGVTWWTGREYRRGDDLDGWPGEIKAAENARLAADIGDSR